MTKRKFPIGSEVIPEGISFRVYAPLAKKLSVIIENQNQEFPLTKEPDGHFSGLIPKQSNKVLYRFRIDDDQQGYPDPASRFQPEGPFGPSEVIDPSTFSWTDQNWKGCVSGMKGQVLYEMHIGTFTQEGTFKAAQEQLKELSEIGITVIELMPLHEFPGRFNWGYDGVNLFAPPHTYGTPDDVRNFINAAHELSMAVILDVVYNHFGPYGNYIEKFATDYLIEENTDWGKAVNFDHSTSREFFLTNAQYWIDEFHFDGLRVDATHSFFCHTEPQINYAIQKVAREIAPHKRLLIIGENEAQESIIFRPVERGGYGFDALWNDDFHHTALVNLRGKREAYYTDYKGTAQELASCLTHGFLYQGQYYTWQKKNRGTPCLDIPLDSFVLFLENHDQIANLGHGFRLSQNTNKANLRALTCLLLLSTGTPLLFQGQEFGSSSPFLYFADHPEELTKIIHESRKKFLAQFKFLSTEEVQRMIASQGDIEVFKKCKLNFNERITNEKFYQFHKDLLKIKREDSVFSDYERTHQISTISKKILILRYFGKNGQNRLLVFNFDVDYKLDPAPYPLLAPPENRMWKTIFSTDSPHYGGDGEYTFNQPIWVLPAHSAYIFADKEKGV